MFTQQYDNILLIITENKLYTVYFNNVIGDHIKFDITQIYGNGFKQGDGLIQSINGQSYIRYNSGNVINNIKFPKYLKDIFQVKDSGVAQYIENGKIKYCLFKINGLTVEISTNNIVNSGRFIGYKDKQFIILPEDDKLKFLRLEDFNSITEYDCNMVSESSQVFICNAGIIVKEGNNLILINKK